MPRRLPDAAVAALGVLAQQVFSGFTLCGAHRLRHRRPLWERAVHRRPLNWPMAIGYAKVKPLFGARKSILRTWRSCRTTSCSTCAKASCDGRGESDPPDQRIRAALLGDQRRFRMRSSERPRRDSCIYWRPGAGQPMRCGTVPMEHTFIGAAGARDDPPHFAALGEATRPQC